MHSSIADYLPLDTLDAIAEQESENYKNAQPFSHGVYDNIFSQELLDLVLEEFNKGKKYWREFDSPYEKKFQMNSDISMGPATRTLVYHLNSAPFLNFLEKLTGISGLIPDPYLHGAGLHKIPPGGKLGVHVDFNGHKRMNVYRRINVLIYLNKDWDIAWGGDFQLWCAKDKKCKKSVPPLFNRMAIFSTTNTSFHGHPEPLQCPKDRERVSLAMYYYTANDRGNQNKKLHSTLFLNKEGKIDELGKKNPIANFAARVMRKLSPTS